MELLSDVGVDLTSWRVRETICLVVSLDASMVSVAGAEVGGRRRLGAGSQRLLRFRVRGTITWNKLAAIGLSK